MSHTLVTPEVFDASNTANSSNSSNSCTTSLEYYPVENYDAYVGPIYMGTPTQSNNYMTYASSMSYFAPNANYYSPSASSTAEEVSSNPINISWGDNTIWS